MSYEVAIMDGVWELRDRNFFYFLVVENESESGQGKRVKFSDLLGEVVAVSIFR